MKIYEENMDKKNFFKAQAKRLLWKTRLPKCVEHIKVQLGLNNESWSIQFKALGYNKTILKLFSGPWLLIHILTKNLHFDDIK